MWVLHLAQGRYLAFVSDNAARFRFNLPLWLAFVGASMAAGLLFGLAALFPFSRVRFQRSRLLLAALASLPLLQFWLIFGILLPHGHTLNGWIATTSQWFGGIGTQHALAVLAGVAVASGFRPIAQS